MTTGLLNEQPRLVCGPKAESGTAEDQPQPAKDASRFGTFTPGGPALGTELSEDALLFRPAVERRWFGLAGRKRPAAGQPRKAEDFCEKQMQHGGSP